MRYFLKHDPAREIARLRVPALAVWGERDVQVLPEVNAPPVRKALEKAPEGSRAVILPSLNHLLQTCETGDVLEYARIEETMSPLALGEITSWMTKQINSVDN